MFTEAVKISSYLRKDLPGSNRLHGIMKLADPIPGLRGLVKEANLRKNLLRLYLKSPEALVRHAEPIYGVRSPFARLDPTINLRSLLGTDQQELLPLITSRLIRQQKGPVRSAMTDIPDWFAGLPDEKAPFADLLRRIRQAPASERKNQIRSFKRNRGRTNQYAGNFDQDWKVRRQMMAAAQRNAEKSHPAYKSVAGLDEMLVPGTMINHPSQMADKFIKGITHESHPRAATRYLNGVIFAELIDDGNILASLDHKHKSLYIVAHVKDKKEAKRLAKQLGMTFHD
jgi:hypothetical protein